MFIRPTIEDVREALKPLADIRRPYGDNEDDPINSESVISDLKPAHQEVVRHADRVCREYTRGPDGQPDRRAITHMVKSGFPSHLNQDQYTPEKLVGQVTIGDWSLDISDEFSDED